ncbi:hypothetical protein BG006_007293 [Podila minutissima]|uniref:BTB domain-containing protein n=1 Tax=Podila minutissima TaxID=64525 RepID=A0A9P5SJX8_9FUNG|nr:hypothetical protein BG006_007293 [Podila minutissima]
MANLPIFQSLRVLSDHEKYVNAERVYGLNKDKCVLIFEIRLSDVSVDKWVVFDVILSTSKDSVSDLKATERSYTICKSVVMLLMKDIGTMDIALTFGISGRARNGALWAHRSVLEQQSGLAKLISKLKAVEGSWTDSGVAASVQSYHVTEFSLESYCVLIRYMYTGIIDLEVDLNDSAIGFPPNQPFTIACKERPTVKGLLVDCSGVQDLRAHCRSRIIASTDVRNVLSILFGYAYRFKDLKSVVLKFVVNHLDKLNAGDMNPFEE